MKTTTTRRRFVAGALAASAATTSGLLACATGPSAASTTTTPTSARSRSFARVRTLMESFVTQGKTPGAVWLVARGDDVVVDSVGLQGPGSPKPMRRDTIFRIASMTKPVTAVAMLMLVEEGKLDLDGPVERWLPELEDRRVLKNIEGPLDDTEPAARAITVRDLLVFTLGFGIRFENESPIQRAIASLQLSNAEPVPMTPHAPDEWLRRFATLPLMHQPGERWMYNTGSLLQGVLVRRASGQDFDAFVRERILGPLGLRDTDFFVPADKLDRYAGCAPFHDPARGEVRVDEDGAKSAYAKPPVFPSGAAGLVSTADDFHAFARMLLNGGEHDGRRLLREESVRAMTTDHVTAAQKAASSSTFFPGFFDNTGWGYGVAVVTKDTGLGSVGSYGWDGGFGATWVSDPKRDTVVIALTQSVDFLFSGPKEELLRAVFAPELG